MRAKWELFSYGKGISLKKGESPLIIVGQKLMIVFDEDITAREGDQLTITYIEDPDDRRSPGD